MIAAQMSPLTLVALLNMSRSLSTRSIGLIASGGKFNFKNNRLVIPNDVPGKAAIPSDNMAM